MWRWMRACGSYFPYSSCGGVISCRGGPDSVGGKAQKAERRDTEYTRIPLNRMRETAAKWREGEPLLKALQYHGTERKTCSQCRFINARCPRRRARPWWAGRDCAALMLCGLIGYSQGLKVCASSVAGAMPTSKGTANFVVARTRIHLPSLHAHVTVESCATLARGGPFRRHCSGTTTTATTVGAAAAARRYSRKHGQLLHSDLLALNLSDHDYGEEQDEGDGVNLLSDRAQSRATATASTPRPIAVPESTSATLTTSTSPPVHTFHSTATTRLDFLKQTSVAALVFSAAVASSNWLLPNQPVVAAVDAENAAGSTSAGKAPSTTAESMRVLPGEDMVWLNTDSGTVVSRLSKVDETFCEGFVAYLARFLLNYDDGCKRYFQHKVDIAVRRVDGTETWEEFRSFVASVGFGLHRYQGANGARELCEALSRKYASRNRGDGSAGQLAMLFSLLPPERQPVSGIKSLLALSSERASRALALDVSVLEASPISLLPNELRPVYDQSVKAFVVPGFSSLANGGENQLVFGTRGTFPISKERKLTAADFGLFAACGALGCTTTHLTVIPLDVVKTRLQTDPGRYPGLAQGVSTIAREEGWPMLLQGLGPTLTGYLWYGITVYPGYELFKRLYIGLAGPLNAGVFRVPLVLAAGASATLFACIGVCPAEAVRIRQVADPSVGSMSSAVKQIVSESGWGKLYEGLPSILFRQISFGMMKFLVFDFFSDFVYGILPVLAEQTSTQLTVSLVSGLVAGVCAAIVSQPADTVMSVMNKNPGRATIPGTVRSIVEEQGPSGLFLGLWSRIVWSGAIISGQFLLYDVCKTALHVGADDLKVFLDVIASAGL